MYKTRDDNPRGHPRGLALRGDRQQAFLKTLRALRLCGEIGVYYFLGPGIGPAWPIMASGSPLLIGGVPIT